MDQVFEFKRPPKKEENRRDCHEGIYAYEVECYKCPHHRTCPKEATK